MAMLSVRPITVRTRPLHFNLGGPGSHAGSGPRGVEALPVSWGNGSPPVLEPAPPRRVPVRAALLQRCCLCQQRCVDMSWGQPAPSLAEVPPSSIGRSREMEDGAALIQALGNALNKGRGHAAEGRETQSRRHSELKLHPHPHSQQRGQRNHR